MEVDSAFLEQRAISLATVLLTRHPKVSVVVPHRRTGYDLEASIGSKGMPTGRLFAVELKAGRNIAQIGTVEKPHQLRLRGPIRRSLEGQVDRLKDITFPLLYLVFEMSTDRGYFGWLREPLGDVASLGRPSIEVADEWLQETHLRIVEQVDIWYERRAVR